MLYQLNFSYEPNTKNIKIMSSTTKMDEEVAESIKSFIETSMKTIDQEVRKCNVLKDELQMCQRATDGSSVSI